MNYCKYCKKCNQPFDPKADTNHNLCPQCYHDYLLDMIEHLDELPPKSEKGFLTILLEKIKQFFYKEK